MKYTAEDFEREASSITKGAIGDDKTADMLQYAASLVEDAERWNKLKSMIDVEENPGNISAELWIGDLGEYKRVGEPILDGEHLLKVVDAARKSGD